MNNSQVVQKLLATEITPESFRLYGQVIYATEDGASTANAAQLVLSPGIPRFYIMRLHQKGCKFHQITRHLQCTQCLGSLEGKEWLLAVAPPNNVEKPLLEEIVAFRIPGNCFIKLEVGTWHAGPYFKDDFVDFYNLELNDTNINDHDSFNFLEHHNLELEIIG
jgi:ureidoglycolate hydrolase